MNTTEFSNWFKSYNTIQKMDEYYYCDLCRVNFYIEKSSYNYFNLYYQQKALYGNSELQVSYESVARLFIFLIPLLFLLPVALFFI